MKRNYLIIMPTIKPLKIIPILAFLALALCIRQTAADSDEIIIDNYQNRISSKWKSKSFSGQTDYRLDQYNNQPAIHATSNGSASGLFYEIEYDPRQYPVLSWSWKIDNIIQKGDARHKEGDDYAARVYVVFPSWLFWKTRAINYIWANRLPKETMIANAFTDNAIMIAVRSGPTETGQWLFESRNIYEDYRRAFGEEPPKAGAVAIMTDTDNTGETASAWYGVISIKTR